MVGAAEVRGAADGDVRRAGVLFIPEMARPKASLAWCSFIDCFMHEDGDGVADVIPCALCRGGRDSFAKLRLVLGRIQGDTPGVPSRGEVPREGKTLARLARLGEPGP